MKAITILATLVAMCLGLCLVSGCVPVAGPQNCPYGTQGFGCAPDPSADGSSTDATVSGDSNPNGDTAPPVEVKQDACSPYQELIKWLEAAGTWKQCVFSKTNLVYNLTFKAELNWDKTMCFGVAVEDTAYVYIPSIKPAPDGLSFTGTDKSGESSVVCSK